MGLVQLFGRGGKRLPNRSLFGKAKYEPTCRQEAEEIFGLGLSRLPLTLFLIKEEG